MKNPIKATVSGVKSLGRKALQSVHDRSEYLLVTTRAERKAHRKEARMAKKCARATRKAAKAAAKADKYAKAESDAKASSGLRNRVAEFRPFGWLGREQAKA